MERRFYWFVMHDCIYVLDEISEYSNDNKSIECLEEQIRY